MLFQIHKSFSEKHTLSLYTNLEYMGWYILALVFGANTYFLEVRLCKYISHGEEQLLVTRPVVNIRVNQIDIYQLIYHLSNAVSFCLAQSIVTLSSDSNQMELDTE